MTFITSTYEPSNVLLAADFGLDFTAHQSAARAAADHSTDILISCDLHLSFTFHQTAIPIGTGQPADVPNS
jgi:hypothetical protein